MAPPRVNHDPAIWGATNLAALEFRGVAARRVAMGNPDRELLRSWLLRLAEDNRLLIERLRDCGHA